MATLHLMVGLPGSGKTTRAKELENALPAVRLTPDEWHLRLFGHDLDDPAHDMRHSEIEALLWEVAARILMQDVDVILDFGFWSRIERDDFRRRAAELKAKTVIHYESITLEEISARLIARNAALPAGAFSISSAMISRWAQMFQPPGDDELVVPKAEYFYPAFGVDLRDAKCQSRARSPPALVWKSPLTVFSVSRMEACRSPISSTSASSSALEIPRDNGVE